MTSKYRMRFNTESIFTRDRPGLVDRWEKRVIRVHLEHWELLDLEVMLENLDQRWGHDYDVITNVKQKWVILTKQLKHHGRKDKIEIIVFLSAFSEQNLNIVKKTNVLLDVYKWEKNNWQTIQSSRCVDDFFPSHSRYRSFFTLKEIVHTVYSIYIYKYSIKI